MNTPTIPAAVAVHLAAAILAFVAGVAMLARPKGTPAHKALGRAWIALIAVVAFGSFWIQELRGGAGFSLIHALSLWTLFAVTMGFVAIRRGQVRRHRGWMVGTFIGLIVAGLFALAPGRMIPALLFG